MECYEIGVKFNQFNLVTDFTFALLHVQNVLYNIVTYTYGNYKRQNK